MSHLTLHLPDEVREKVRRAADSAGVSQSKWVAELIKKEFSDAWPQEILDLAGAWPDAPTAEELRADLGEDVLREAF